MNWLSPPMVLAVALCVDAASLQADSVDELVGSQMESHHIPGVAMIVLRHGEAVKIGCYGFANLELKVPVKPETAFEIGSITKQFTAAGVLLLVQDGRLALEDSISRYLQGVPKEWEAITLRHLMNHTSGLRSYTGLPGFELRKHLSAADFVAAIGRYPLEFEPGEKWKYCNTGYNLLGFVIEKVTQRPYWDFLGERIFTPLGMLNTTNRQPQLIIPNRASGYERTNQMFLNRDYDVTDVFSAGAMVSTVLDLAKWSNALDGDKILNSRSKSLMWTPATLNDGRRVKYSLGWGIDRFEGRQNIGHSGSTSGFSASLQRFPDDGLVVIVLTNTDDEIATNLALGIAREYLGTTKEKGG